MTTETVPTATSAPGTTAVVVGDGTTAGSRTRSRWRRWRWPAAVAGLVVLVAIAAALPQPALSDVPFAPDNPADDGARALAQILGRQGVEIEYVRTSAQATRAAVPGTTLLVTSGTYLTDDQIGAVAGTDADLVLLDPDGYLLDGVTDAVVAAEVAPDAGPTRRDARCDDPDAVAAGTLRAGGAGYEARTDSATVCFPTADGGPGTYATVAGDRRIVVLGDPSVLSNAQLPAVGNAALAVRMLGRHAHLTWYVPAIDDFGQAAAGPPLADLVPPWTGAVALELLLVAAVAALWRGRRLGRLVTEPLPVTVRAAEATRGRGRLYRRGRAYGHAGAALRAGTATRTAARLGLPRTAGGPAMIEALALATGRRTDDVAHLLYGPPPTDDAGLQALAQRLDDLESEVHRP